MRYASSSNLYSLLWPGEEKKQDGPRGSEGSYGDWAKEAAYLAAGAVVSGVAIAGPALAGFGADGVALNSAAAALQSTIGNVVSSSTFSALQSFGATYTSAPAVGAGLVAVGAAGLGYLAYTSYYAEEEYANGA